MIHITTNPSSRQVTLSTKDTKDTKTQQQKKEEFSHICFFIMYAKNTLASTFRLM